MKYIKIILSLSVVILISTAFNQNRPSNAKVKDPFLIDLEDLKAKNYFSKTTLVTINKDPVYHHTKRYLAVPLVDVLKNCQGFSTMNPKTTEVYFETTDGYNPSMKLSKLLSCKVYLAVKDADAPKGSDWIMAIKNKVANNAAPFYVVYTDISEKDGSYKWPYGLLKIRLLPESQAKKYVLPNEDRELASNFEIFKINCMPCHAVNDIGGSMGPELNYPKNITEYWTEADIKAFVRDPSSYRNNNRMPALAATSDSTFQAIFAYLHVLKNHKKQK